MQGKGFPADDPLATTVNVVIYDHRFGSNTKLSVPCSVLSVAANGRSLQCVLSRPDYEHTPYFDILLYGVPVCNDDLTSNPIGRRLLAAGTVEDASVEDRGRGGDNRAAAAAAVVKTMTEDSPTGQPTCQPINHPSRVPTRQPTSRPSRPSGQPSHRPSSQPSR